MSAAPTVTQADVDAEVVNTTFTVLPEGRTTICEITMRNGFTVRGESSCVCIENFNKELGEKYSLEDAKRKIWPLLGYLLKEHLHGQSPLGQD